MLHSVTASWQQRIMEVLSLAADPKPFQGCGLMLDVTVFVDEAVFSSQPPAIKDNSYWYRS